MIILHSGAHRQAAVDGEHRTGDVAGTIVEQKCDRSRELIGIAAAADGNHPHDRVLCSLWHRRRHIGVETPGTTQFTVMPARAVSCARDRVRPCSPALAAPYAASLGLPITAVTELTFTIRPKLCCRIPGMTARHRWKAAERFTATARSQSSTDVSVDGLSTSRPALLTSKSSRPWSSLICPTRSSHSDGSATSAFTVAAPVRLRRSA